MPRYNTDIIPAMLSPGEAVLNRNAADLVGRNRITALNAMGNAAPTPPDLLNQMYLENQRRNELARALAMNEQPRIRMGFQSGTSNVKRDDRADLLREIDNTIYGGGQAPPQPTPTPTPRRGYQYGTSNVPYDSNDPFQYGGGYNSPTNAVSRTRSRARSGGGILNVTPSSNPVSSSRYIGSGGVDLGAQYDPTGMVNPLPSGAAGVQGATQPRAGMTPATSPAMTHTQMAVDIARRNLTSAGSSLGASPDDSQLFSPPSGIPRGANATRITGISSETLDNLGITPESYANTDWAKVQEIQNNAEIPQLRSIGGYDQPSPVTPGQSASQSPGVSADELSNAGIRPGRYSDAIGPINRSGTGYSYMGPHGKVDMAGPMHSAAVRAAVERADRNGYGSTYGY